LVQKPTLEIKENLLHRARKDVWEAYVKLDPTSKYRAVTGTWWHKRGYTSNYGVGRKIWGFHGDVSIDDLHCCVVLYFGCVPTFQKNILPLSSGLKWPESKSKVLYNWRSVMASTSEQSFVSEHCFHFVNVDNILMRRFKEVSIYRGVWISSVKSYPRALQSETNKVTQMNHGHIRFRFRFRLDQLDMILLNSSIWTFSGFPFRRKSSIYL
jgi:hypothetical protein